MTTFSRLPKVVVAVPVKDEAERIGDCLRALALQQDSDRHQILLLLNNCSDGTADIIRDLIPTLPVVVHLIEKQLAPDQANAGYARYLAMERAAAIVHPDGILMTTDADGRVCSDWISASLSHFNNGADAVAGFAEIDPVEASLIPSSLHEADAAECEYAALIDEINSFIDPDPADPWPRHDQHSGASIAVTATVYRKAGGMEPIPTGEDRAFGQALRKIDARLRHAPEVRVVVSGRIAGRAKGGMADTIRRRMIKLDEMLDDRLEPINDAVRRAKIRRACFNLWKVRSLRLLQVFADGLQLDAETVTEILSRRYFGAAWAEIEVQSPVLVKRRVFVADLPYQTKTASEILAALYERNKVAQLIPKIADGSAQTKAAIVDYTSLSAK